MPLFTDITRWLKNHAWALGPAMALPVNDVDRGRPSIAARIVSIHPVSSRAVAIRLKPSRRWAGHVPGQFCTLELDINGVRHRRCYSVTSLPEDATVEIVVQALAGGIVSSYLCRQATVGEVLWLAPAAGDFTLAAAPENRPLLFITAGSGLTPTLALARQLRQQQAKRSLVWLHFAPERGAMLCAEQLSSWDASEAAFDIRVFFTRNQGQLPTRLTQHWLEQQVPDWRTRHAYVCGPVPVLAAAEAIWSEAGNSAALSIERFSHPDSKAIPTSKGSACHNVRFSRSNVLAQAEPQQNLLELAEAAGLSPPFGCRMGVCHSCVQQLRVGRVCDLRDQRIRNAGEHIQLCVCTPISDVDIEL